MMHFVSHPWQVQDVEDGTVVKLSEAEMQDGGLADDLMELFLENGRPKLYLDLLDVRSMSSSVARKLFGLDGRIQKAGGRLVLCNLSTQLSEALQTRDM